MKIPGEISKIRTQKICGMLSGVLAILSLTGPVPAAEPKPVLVVYETNLVRAGALGEARAPAFILYENGEAIWRPKNTVNGETFVTGPFADAEEMLKNLFSADVIKGKDDYKLTGVTCQGSTDIWALGRRIGIYGNWRIEPYPNSNDKPDVRKELELRKSLPGALRQTLIRIDEQRKQSGRAWLPEEIEVDFWSYEHSKDKALIWPEDWPDLNSKSTKRKSEHLYTVFLPSEKLPQLWELLSIPKGEQAVWISGRKMLLHARRIHFPGEEKWRQ